MLFIPTIKKILISWWNNLISKKNDAHLIVYVPIPQSQFYIVNMDVSTERIYNPVV